MEASLRRSNERIERLVKDLVNLKYRHSAMFDSLLELNKKWKTLNDEQIRAYAETRDKDVTRYDVLIRANTNDTERLHKQLDKIHLEIKAVTTKLEEEQAAARSFKKSAKGASAHIPIIICGSNPEDAIVLKQHQLSGRKRRALVRCLELINDLKWGEIHLNIPSEKQIKDETVRRRFKCDELNLQIKFMQRQQDKLETLDDDLSTVVIDDIKRTLEYILHLITSS